MNSNKLLKALSWLYFKLIFMMSVFYFYVIGKGKVFGESNLPSTNNYILALNHVSYLDWLLVYAYFKFNKHIDTRFVAKEKLFSHPAWKWVMVESKSIMAPERPSIDAYKKFICEVNEANTVLGIFPEGTRTADGLIAEAKTGVISIAVGLQRPIVPVALSGFYEAWSRERLLPKLFNCNLTITFGEPIIIDHTKQDVDRSESAKVIMQAINNLMNKNT